MVSPIEVSAGVPPVPPLARVVRPFVAREPAQRGLPRVEPARDVVGVSFELEHREYLSRGRFFFVLDLVIRGPCAPASDQRAPPRGPVAILRDLIHERALTVHAHQDAVQLTRVQPEGDVPQQQQTGPLIR